MAYLGPKRRLQDPHCRYESTSSTQPHKTVYHMRPSQIQGSSRDSICVHYAAAVNTAESSATAQPPDVMPHVLLALEPGWQSSSNSSTPKQQHSGQQDSWLLPRTSVRLQGVQLPAFIPRLTVREEPLVTLWKHQAAVAWHTAAVWAKRQQQQQQELQPLQQPHLGQLQLLQLFASHQNHWGPAAAVLDAAGPWLHLQHLMTITKALVSITPAIADGSSISVDTSETNFTSGSSRLSGNDACADTLFKPALLVIGPDLQHGPATQQMSIGGHGRMTVARVLKCTDLVTRLSVLLLHQLRQQHGAESLPDSWLPTRGSSSSTAEVSSAASCTNTSSVLDTALAVQLLQQLSHLHTFSRLGSVDSDLITELLSNHIHLQHCTLIDLSVVIHSCGRLGHPHSVSWLAGFVSIAVEKMKDCQQEGSLGPTVARLLDGLSMYPGPHLNSRHLHPILISIQSQLQTLTPTQLHQLLTAAAHLGLQPDQAWFETAAAAAQQRSITSNFRELVLMLQGLTAMAEHCKLQIDDSWFRFWLEVTAGRCAAVTLAATAATAAAAAAAAETDGGEVGSFAAMAVGSSSRSDGYVNNGAIGGAPDRRESHGNNGTSQQQQHQQPEVIAADLIFDALFLLVQARRPVHPLWLAGTLEAYLRSAYDPASTPQLMLLVSDLLDNPPSFVVRHRALMNRLMQPLAHSLAELNPEQITQAAEACAVFDFNPGVDWFRWHSAAILRYNTVFPLQPLARIDEAYKRLQQVPADHRLLQLIRSVQWRIAAQGRRQKAQQRREELQATITFKNEQRRRQNVRDREALEKKKSNWRQRDAQKRGVGGQKVSALEAAGGGPRPEGKQQWRKRKLRPPGTLDRKY